MGKITLYPKERREGGTHATCLGALNQTQDLSPMPAKNRVLHTQVVALTNLFMGIDRLGQLENHHMKCL